MSTEIQEYDFLEKIRHEGFGEKFTNFLASRKEPRFKVLRATLMDKRYKGVPLVDLCTASGVEMIDLERSWIDYNRSRGLIRMATQLPEVMEDIAIDSRTVVVKCKNCEGLGRIESQPNFPECPICDGSGKVRKIGDRHSRDLLFDTMKLTTKEPLVNIQNTFSLENIVGDASKILRSTSEIIDVQPEAQ